MFVPRQESGFRKLGDLPAASNQAKIEVWSRAGEDGTPLLELVEYSWGSGIGWYVQKRVTLDAAQMDALKSLLGKATGSTEAPRPARSLPSLVQDGNVIQLVFPG